MHLTIIEIRKGIQRDVLVWWRGWAHVRKQGSLVLTRDTSRADIHTNPPHLIRQLCSNQRD